MVYIVFLGGFGMVGLACLILAGQVILWLYYGIWPSFSVLDLFIFVFGTKRNPWLVSPQTWLGLYRLLNFLSASVLIAAAGLFGMMLGADMDASRPVFKEPSPSGLSKKDVGLMILVGTVLVVVAGLVWEYVNQEPKLGPVP